MILWECRKKRMVVKYLSFEQCIWWKKKSFVDSLTVLSVNTTAIECNFPCHLPENCVIYAYMPENCQRFALYIPNIYQRDSWYTSEISMRFAYDLHEISHTYFKILPQLSFSTWCSVPLKSHCFVWGGDFYLSLSSVIRIKVRCLILNKGINSFVKLKTIFLGIWFSVSLLQTL